MWTSNIFCYHEETINNIEDLYTWPKLNINHYHGNEVERDITWGNDDYLLKNM